MQQQLVTQTAFAKLCQVSAEAVRKGCESGKINIVGKGRKKKINLDGANTIAYLHDKNSQRIKPKIPKSYQIPQKNNAGEIEQDQSPQNDNKMSLLDDNIDITKVTAQEIKKLKDLESARKSAEDRRKSRGKLIERSLVKFVLGKIYTIEVNQIKPIADKVPSRIAAIFENDDSEKILAVSQLLTEEHTKALKHIKYTIDKFLAGLEDQNNVGNHVSQ